MLALGLSMSHHPSQRRFSWITASSPNALGRSQPNAQAMSMDSEISSFSLVSTFFKVAGRLRSSPLDDRLNSSILVRSQR